MSFLQRLLGGPIQAGEAPPPDHDFWYESIMRAASGVNVTADTALTVPAVRRGISVLAGSIASLPLKVLERTADGSEVAENHPLFDVLHRQPNPYMSSYDFRQILAANLILFNAAYARIRPGPRGPVETLTPIRSDRVTPEQLPTGRIRFRVSDPVTGRNEVLVQEEMFWVKGFGLGELRPPTLVQQGRDVIGLGVALSRMLSGQFRNGVRLSGVLEHPTTLGEEAGGRIRGQWQRLYGGVDAAGSTAILEEGMKFHELSQSNKGGQIVEVWLFIIEEIARLLGIPSVLMGHSDKTSTYASAEQFFLSFIAHSLRPWLVCIEQAINTQLIMNQQRFKAEFAVEGLLRGDSAARAAFYKSGIDAGWLSPNEARRLENLNRREGADDLRVPLNMSRIDERGNERRGEAGPPVGAHEPKANGSASSHL